MPYPGTESSGRFEGAHLSGSNTVSHADTANLSIGQLAQAARVNVETVRYYQRRRLLTEPTKPLGGHRRYALDAVKRLRFIKRAQSLGFTLDEVGDLLTLEDGRSCRDARLLAERKLALIEDRL